MCIEHERGSCVTPYFLWRTEASNSDRGLSDRAAHARGTPQHAKAERDSEAMDSSYAHASLQQKGVIAGAVARALRFRFADFANGIATIAPLRQMTSEERSRLEGTLMTGRPTYGFCGAPGDALGCGAWPRWSLIASMSCTLFCCTASASAWPST